MCGNIIKKVREESPLIHCITNYVTANDVANTILALGASPVMADGIHEAEDVASLSKALVINIGTLDERTVDSMILAGRRANELGHPVVLDPVGAGASAYRTKTARHLLEELRFSVIRGNASEIRTLAGLGSGSKGVDAGEPDVVAEHNLDASCELLKQLSRNYQAVVALTGAIDILSDGAYIGIVRNGHSWMSRITGTGCMLDGVLASCLAVEKAKSFHACIQAVAAVGICGEMAYEASKDKGTGSFRQAFIDAVSRIDDNMLKEGARIEIR